MGYGILIGFDCGLFSVSDMVINELCIIACTVWPDSLSPDISISLPVITGLASTPASNMAPN